MTKSLEQAFREASKLPEAEQDALAEAIRAEITSDDAWDASISTSAEELGQLADEAIAEHRSGRTQLVKPGKR
jgi:hypothetical protein